MTSKRQSTHTHNTKIHIFDNRLETKSERIKVKTQKIWEYVCVLGGGGQSYIYIDLIAHTRFVLCHKNRILFLYLEADKIRVF